MDNSFGESEKKQKKKVIGPLSEIALFVPPDIDISNLSSQQQQQQQQQQRQQQPAPPPIVPLHSLQLYGEDGTPLGLSSLRLVNPRNVNAREVKQRQPPAHSRHHRNSSSISSNVTTTTTIFQENTSPVTATSVPYRSTPFPFPRPYPNNQTNTNTNTAATTSNNDHVPKLVRFLAKLTITTPDISNRDFLSHLSGTFFSGAEGEEGEEEEEEEEGEDRKLHPNLTPYGSKLVRGLGVSQNPSVRLYTPGEEVDILVEGFAVGYSYQSKGKESYILLYTSHPTSNLQSSPIDSSDHRRYKIETLSEKTLYLSANTLRSHGLLTMMQRIAAEEPTRQGRDGPRMKPKPQTIEWYIHRYRSQHPTLSVDPESRSPSSPSALSSSPPRKLRPSRSTFYQLFLPALTTYDFRETAIDQGLLEPEALQAFDQRVAEWERAGLVEWVPDRFSEGDESEKGSYRVVWNQGIGLGGSSGWEDMSERETTPMPTPTPTPRRVVPDGSLTSPTSALVPSPDEITVMTTTTTSNHARTPSRTYTGVGDTMVTEREEQDGSGFPSAEQEDIAASMNVDGDGADDGADMDMQDEPIVEEEEVEVDELNEEEVDELDEDESADTGAGASASADNSAGVGSETGRAEGTTMLSEHNDDGTGPLVDHGEIKIKEEEENASGEEDLNTMIRRLPWYFFDVPDLLEDVLLDQERERQEKLQREQHRSNRSKSSCRVNYKKARTLVSHNERARVKVE
ncbi:hypothetical protein FRB91_002645 [Serendipita sp. 411]|nr:hypothetical protein FRB91_002645 [Serendipita sp. 411]